MLLIKIGYLFDFYVKNMIITLRIELIRWVESFFETICGCNKIGNLRVKIEN